MRRARRRTLNRRSLGFSLFEMIVVICSIAILYMIAEQRINELPAAAERANFQAVLGQIRTGVNLAMISRMAGGGAADARLLAGTNPIDQLLEAPSSYLGELAQVTDAVRRRNAWYFESGTGMLVYLVGGNSIDDVWVTVAGVPVNLGQLRFRIENLYDDGQGGLLWGSRLGNQQAAGSWQGVQLVPVNEYSWEQAANLEIGSVGGGEG